MIFPLLREDLSYYFVSDLFLLPAMQAYFREDLSYYFVSDLFLLPAMQAYFIIIWRF